MTEPSTPPVVCKTLGGPWGEDLDPGRVALPRHETLKVESETLLLEGDGLPLAIEWHRIGDARVLVVANGSFLLNGALLNRARRPLAERVADWVGDPPRRVAFVEGGRVLGGRRGPPSVFELLRVSPFGWVAAQMLALGWPSAWPVRRGWAGPGPRPPPTRTAPPPTPRRSAPSWRGPGRPPTPGPSSTPIVAGDIPRPPTVRRTPPSIEPPARSLRLVPRQVLPGPPSLMRQ